MEALEGLDEKATVIAWKGVSRILSTRHREAVEDVMQEAKLRAFQKAHLFEGKSSYSTWFYRIATNQALMHLRKRDNTRLLSGTLVSQEDEGISSAVDNMLDSSPNPEEQFLLQEHRELIWDAIQRLRPALRKSILKYIDPERNERLSGKDKSNVFRAKAQLRELLDEFRVV